MKQKYKILYKNTNYNKKRIMNILENYQKAKQTIYDHVGFVED